MRLTPGDVESLRGPSTARTHRILSRTTGPGRDIPVACGMGRPPESSAGAPRMKAVILAAGEGARMGPFTASGPKGMIPVGNRPPLEYVVQALAENGVRDLIFVVGYRRERIQSHFQDGKAFGAHITYVTQTKQLGTAHAIWEARGHLEDPFIVLNGSNMVDARFVEDLLAAAPKPAVLITQSERPQSYGVVTVRGKELVAITEKPAEIISNLINTGAYVLDSRIFDEIERLAKEGKNDLPSAVSALAKRASVAALLTEGMWVDALYPWDLLRLNAAALKTTAERRAGTIEPAVTIRGRVNIEGTWHSVPQIGALIGEDVEIANGVNAAAGTVVNERARVESGAKLRGTIPAGAVVL